MYGIVCVEAFGGHEWLAGLAQGGVLGDASDFWGAFGGHGDVCVGPMARWRGGGWVGGVAAVK